MDLSFLDLINIFEQLLQKTNHAQIKHKSMLPRYLELTDIDNNNYFNRILDTNKFKKKKYKKLKYKLNHNEIDENYNKLLNEFNINERG